jgi:hypothetical protein
MMVMAAGRCIAWARPAARAAIGHDGSMADATALVLLPWPLRRRREGLLSFAVAAMSFATYLGFTVVLPLLAPGGPAGPAAARWCLYASACLFLYVNACFNYLAAALVSPGTAADRCYRALVEQALRAGCISAAQHERPALMALHPLLRHDFGARAWVMKPPFEWGYCEEARCLKPPRSHFCRQSEQLVLNLDHYCYWLGTAVGCELHKHHRTLSCFVCRPHDCPCPHLAPADIPGGWDVSACPDRNYRHYLLFLLYFTLATVFAAGSCLAPYCTRMIAAHEQLTAGRPPVVWDFIVGYSFVRPASCPSAPVARLPGWRAGGLTVSARSFSGRGLTI